MSLLAPAVIFGSEVEWQKHILEVFSVPFWNGRSLTVLVLAAMLAPKHCSRVRRRRVS